MAAFGLTTPGEVALAIPKQEYTLALKPDQTRKWIVAQLNAKSKPSAKPK